LGKTRFGEVSEYHRLERPAAASTPTMSMEGKTCVITGATSGIGQAAAEALAASGARIIVVARSEARGATTIANLRKINPNASHTVHYADLSRVADTKRVAADIAAVAPRVDVLINNAGALFSYRRTTEEGLECTLALNHVSYFVLTHGLRQQLLSSAPARVINTSSAMHRRAHLDFDDLQFEHGYSGVYAYERSKLCNILFTRELARRLIGTGVTANTLHPGLVASRFGNSSGGLVAPIFRAMKLLLGVSVETGARTIVYLAASPDVAATSGRYFEKCRQVLPALQADDDQAAQRLWIATSKIAGVEWDR
jgi:NAD(P)-dependent dehydrogenase (short-subunit alcohol dehydrogenase family)